MENQKLLPTPRSIYERFHFRADGHRPSKTVLCVDVKLTTEEIESVLDKKCVQIHGDYYDVPLYTVIKLKNILLSRSLCLQDDSEKVLLELIKIEQ